MADPEPKEHELTSVQKLRRNVLEALAAEQAYVRSGGDVRDIAITGSVQLWEEIGEELGWFGEGGARANR